HVPGRSGPDASLHSGWHLGGVKAGASEWAWRASDSTSSWYLGPWPTDGTFDISNGAGNAGGPVFAVGRHVIYGYRGENWKGTQTNKWRHYLDDGLFVAEFGVVAPATQGEAPREMAGNAASGWLVTLPDGRVFIYHNDESWHGGLHRWRIDDLDDFTEQSSTVEWDARPAGAGKKPGAAGPADL